MRYYGICLAKPNFAVILSIVFTTQKAIHLLAPNQPGNGE